MKEVQYISNVDNFLVVDDKLYFKYFEKNAQKAKGQHIVFYLDNELVGGGEIK